MRKYWSIIAVSACLASVALGQATQPVPDGRLEFRAVQAFDRGDYAGALPMLRQLDGELAQRPAKLSAIRERIKVCEKALAAVRQDPAATGSAAGEVQTAPDKRVPHEPPPPGKSLDLTIKQLGNFVYDADKGGGIPADVMKLSGCKVRLTGFMIPMDQADRITQFALVPSLFSCCYGQPPQVQHTIVCNCPKGQAVAFATDPIVVEGTLKVNENRDDGFVTSIFQLEPTSVTVVAKEAKH
jgi:hypothetical protein